MIDINVINFINVKDPSNNDISTLSKRMELQTNIT